MSNNNPSGIYMAVQELDLVIPTIKQVYPLGYIHVVFDGDNVSKVVSKYKYVVAHAALTKYQPYMITLSSTNGKEVTTAAIDTSNAGNSIVCVPQVAITSGYYGFVLIEGDGNALMTAETYAVGDMLSVANAGTALKVIGTSPSTTVTANTLAVCKEAGSTAVKRAICLRGSLMSNGLSGGYTQYGDQFTNGSWRIGINSDGDLTIDKLVAGTWTIGQVVTTS